MIERAVFNARLTVCRACPSWQGACTRGHALDSVWGCPERKFEGVAGSGYQAAVVLPAAPGKTNCCGNRSAAEDIKPMTWVEAFKHLTAAVKIWTLNGFPMASHDVYNARARTCQTCPKNQYQWFQCRQCKCVVFTKARLRDETCPLGLWPPQ